MTTPLNDRQVADNLKDGPSGLKEGLELSDD